PICQTKRSCQGRPRSARPASTTPGAASAETPPAGRARRARRPPRTRSLRWRTPRTSPAAPLRLPTVGLARILAGLARHRSPPPTPGIAGTLRLATGRSSLLVAVRCLDPGTGFLHGLERLADDVVHPADQPQHGADQNTPGLAAKIAIPP